MRTGKQKTFTYTNLEHLFLMMPWTLLCFCKSIHFSGKFFCKILESGCRNVIPYSHKSISEVSNQYYQECDRHVGCSWSHGCILTHKVKPTRFRKQLDFPKLLPLCSTATVVWNIIVALTLTFSSIASGPKPNQIHLAVYWILFISIHISFCLSFRH